MRRCDETSKQPYIPIASTGDLIAVDIDEMK
jgi:hypothetical protein